LAYLPSQLLGLKRIDAALQDHDDHVLEIFDKYSHHGDLSSHVQKATQEVVKAVPARYTVPDLIAQCVKVSSDSNARLA